MSAKPPLILETPSAEVKREATWYCTMGNTLDHYLGYRDIEEGKYFPPRDWDWTPKNAVRWEPIARPEAFNHRWQHFRLNWEWNDVSPHVSDLRITNDAMIPHIPDISAWVFASIVSDRARQILEGIAPDASYFFPLQLYAQDNSPIEKKVWWWVVRDRFYYDQGGLVDQPIVSLPFPGPFSERMMAYDLINNEGVREHLLKFPFWGCNKRLGRVAYRHDTFRTLKAARLTGLVENTEEHFAADRKIHESIGHIP